MVEAVVLGVLLLIVTGYFMWSHFAQRRSMKKILDSLTEEQLEVLKDVLSSPASPRNKSTPRGPGTGTGS